MTTGLTAGVDKVAPSRSGVRVGGKKQVEAVGEVEKTEVERENTTLNHSSSDSKAQGKKVEGFDPLNQEVKEVEEYVQSVQRDLHFSVNESTGEKIVEVYDSSTGELIRQIPSEQMLTMKKIIKQVKGVLFDKRV